MKKIALLAVIAILVAAFFASGLGRYLRLEYIQAARADLVAQYVANPVLMLGGYFLAYVVMAGLSLPGATILSLAGSAVFGFLPTLIAVSFASTIGATLAALTSRYLLREQIEKRFAAQVTRINEGIANEGAFYLFTLRLIPIFPFFVINLVMGLTRMPLRTFYIVSQLGMLPGTAVYINAGTELANLHSLSGIMSPGLLGSFALLGLFPLFVKKTIGAIRRRKANSIAS